jgi:hypothetical protein
MDRPPYPYQCRDTVRYIFISKGHRGAIVKVVQFTPTSIADVYNLSFGDLRPDNTIDDCAISNNHDIARIMITIIHIVGDFTSKNASARVFFTGNTSIKTLIYKRILTRYYLLFSKTFFITGLVKEGRSFRELPFQESGNEKYIAFVIKRKV